MKYYRYAKCMAAGGMHPHASLLIGTSFPDTGISFLLYTLYDAATMLEQHLPWHMSVVRYNSGSRELGLGTHQSETQTANPANV